MTLEEIKKRIKARKPKFSRQDSHKKKKLGNKWKRPKGLHSKMRLQKKGYKRSVKTGYGTPTKIRGLYKNLERIFVSNVDDLKNIDEKKQGVIISSTVGIKKRIEIMKEAEKLKIKNLNIKSPKDYIKKIEEKIEEKKKDKETKKKEKEEKKKEAKKEKKLEKEVEKELSEEEQKELAKKEKDKVLTKKE